MSCCLTRYFDVRVLHACSIRFVKSVYGAEKMDFSQTNCCSSTITTLTVKTFHGKGRNRNGNLKKLWFCAGNNCFWNGDSQNGLLLCKNCHDEFGHLKYYVEFFDGKLVIKIVNKTNDTTSDKHMEWIDTVRYLNELRMISEKNGLVLITEKQLKPMENWPCISSKTT